eukprot:PhF_6_TR21168/c0_g1_i1/m.30497
MFPQTTTTLHHNVPQLPSTWGGQSSTFPPQYSGAQYVPVLATQLPVLHHHHHHHHPMHHQQHQHGHVLPPPHMPQGPAHVMMAFNTNGAQNALSPPRMSPPPMQQDLVLHKGRTYRNRMQSQQQEKATCSFLDALLEDDCARFIDTPPTNGDRCISLSPLAIRTSAATSVSVASSIGAHSSPERSELFTVVEGIRMGHRSSLWIDDGKRVVNQSRNVNNTLPGEVMMTIFKYLAIPDLALAATTCKAWFVRMDPWVYLEHHGWIPLAPLTRSQSVHVRPGVADAEHLPNVFRSCRGCVALTLELTGHASLLPSIAANPEQHKDIVSSWTALTSLQTVHVQKPTVEDMTLLKDLLAAPPSLSTIQVSDLTVPMGVRIIYNVCNTQATTLRLHKVGHLLGPALWRLFKLNPNLQFITLHKCILGCGNANKIKVSCTLQKDGSVHRPIVHATKSSTHTNPSSQFVDIPRGQSPAVCLPCIFQACKVHHGVGPTSPVPPSHPVGFVHAPLPRGTPAAQALYS